MIKVFLLVILFVVGCQKEDSSLQKPVTPSDKKTAPKPPKTAIESNQIGSSWNRILLSDSVVSGSNYLSLETAYRHAGRFKNFSTKGTITYVGKINNIHIGITNYHVLYDVLGSIVTPCNLEFGNKKTSFVGGIVFKGFNNHKFGCKRVIAQWPELDIAIVEVNDFNDGLYLDELKPLKFRFHQAIPKGLKLLTVGYGVYRNNNADLTATWNEECKVFDSNVFHVRVPVAVSPFPDGFLNIPSLYFGCETSAGDSGSAVFDRVKVDVVVGIVWGGEHRRYKEDLADAFISDLYERSDSDLYFDHLSSMVPVTYLFKYLSDWVEQQGSPTEEVRVVESFLRDFGE